MFLHRFRAQHWVLLSVIVLAGFLLLLPQSATPSILAQEPAPPPAPGPNFLPLIYKMPTPTPIPGWRIEYYNNRHLSGSPVATETKTYTHPAEEWGSGAPAPLGNVRDNFSVRFSRSVYFEEGTYAFYLTVDDGGRLYIGDNLVIDEWRGSLRGTATYRHEQALLAGWHHIVVEYYEATGDARARLLWFDAESDPAANWRAEYYANPDLSGEPALVRNESAIDFRWGTGSPAPGVIPADHFSARFTRAMYFSGGTRVLFTEADDRVRVWVDKWAPGTETIDDWADPQCWYSNYQPMDEPGWYLITIEYAEVTADATMRYFDLYGGSRNHWAVEYFDDYHWRNTHQGNPNILTNETPDATEIRVYSNEPGINLNAEDMPDAISTDDFAVRFTRYFKLGGGYEFTAHWDDGMRIWIDGDLVMDRWQSTGYMETRTFTRTLHDGYHVIKVEFYDGRGSAIARLTWRRV